jgi:integral membrane protein
VVLVRIFRIAAIIEAITWIGLLASMYDKYIAHTHTEALHIFGTVHGYAFLAYVLVVFLVRAEYKWSNRMTLLALASSVPPLATVPFERWAFHQRFDEHPRFDERER